MKPTHTRRQGESSQGWGLSGGGPVVSRRGQGTRSRGRSGPGLHPAALQGRLTGPVAGGRGGGPGLNSIARRSTPCQATSVRGQSNQMLSEVLRAGRVSTAGLSPLSTPDSILIRYRHHSLAAALEGRKRG